MFNKSYFYKFGENCFGPILYEFSKWLIENLEREKIDKVFFLARDGMMMKKAFDLVNNTNIESEYLYASRRSMIVPSLWKINNIFEIFEKISFNNSVKIKIFLKKVGLEDFDVSKQLDENELSLDTIIDLDKKTLNPNFVEFLNSIFPLIKENSEKEYKAMMKYYDKKNFYGKVAIADIGWHGTMQMSIQTLFENMDIYGYYMGVIPKDKNETINQKGFLFDKDYNEKLYQKFRYFTGIFEFMFLAREGSTKKYTINDVGYELYEYEYLNTIEAEMAKSIQDGALHYIRNYNERKNKKRCYEKLLKKMLKPNLKDATNFGNIIFQDEEKNYIAKPEKIGKYILKPRKIKEDFIKSNWRIGFFKRLFVIPLPYYYINELIRKIYFIGKENIK